MLNYYTTVPLDLDSKDNDFKSNNKDIVLTKIKT
jgi:hypothetical protein